MPWDLILNKNLLKSVLMDPINSTQDPLKKCTGKRVCIETHANFDWPTNWGANE